MEIIRENGILYTELDRLDDVHIIAEVIISNCTTSIFMVDIDCYNNETSILTSSYTLAYIANNGVLTDNWDYYTKDDNDSVYDECCISDTDRDGYIIGILKDYKQFEGMDYTDIVTEFLKEVKGELILEVLLQ